MEKKRDELQKEIIEFIGAGSSKKGDPNVGCGTLHGLACVLATSKDNVPRSTPVDYYSEGLDIWIVTTSEGKAENVKANPNVSLSIYTPIGDHSVRNRSLQIWGKASFLTYESNPKEYEERAERWGITYPTSWMIEAKVRKGEIPRDKKKEVVEQLVKTFVMIKVEPETIVMGDFEPDGNWNKYTWVRGKESAKVTAGLDV